MPDTKYGFEFPKTVWSLKAFIYWHNKVRLLQLQLCKLVSLLALRLQLCVNPAAIFIRLLLHTCAREGVELKQYYSCITDAMFTCHWVEPRQYSRAIKLRIQYSCTQYYVLVQLWKCSCVIGYLCNSGCNLNHYILVTKAANESRHGSRLQLRQPNLPWINCIMNFGIKINNKTSE